jgi:hypothetical protein
LNAPDTAINNNLTNRPSLDYFRNFDAASAAYGRDVTNTVPYQDYARTPGNVAGNTMLQTGSEVMMPFGGGYSALKGLSTARQVKQGVRQAVDPNYNESRRRFAKTTAGVAAAAALGFPALKQMKVAKTAPIPRGKWDSVVEDIYKADASRTPRPDASRFLRNKSTGRTAALVEDFDHNYAARKIMGEDKYRRMGQIEKHSDSGGTLTPGEETEYFKLADDYHGNSGPGPSAKYESELLSPKNKAKYDAIEKKLENTHVETEYADSLDAYDGSQGRFQTFGQDAIDDLLAQRREVMRNDTNVSSYREKRAKARASALGDELWETHRTKLEADVDHYRSLDNPTHTGSDAIAGELKAHLALKKQVGN